MNLSSAHIYSSTEIRKYGVFFLQKHVWGQMSGDSKHRLGRRLALRSFTVLTTTLHRFWNTVRLTFLS